jgi:hypothetical protein
MSGLDNTSETIRLVTAATTATDNDYFIAVSPGANPTNVALPAPATTIPGRIIVIRRDATATNVVNATGNINGNASATLAVGTAGAIGTVSYRNTGTTWLSSN